MCTIYLFVYLISFFITVSQFLLSLFIVFFSILLYSLKWPLISLISCHSFITYFSFSVILIHLMFLLKALQLFFNHFSFQSFIFFPHHLCLFKFLIESSTEFLRLFNFFISKILNSQSDYYILFTGILYHFLSLPVWNYFRLKLFFFYYFNWLKEFLPHFIELLLHNFGFIFLSLLLLLHHLLLQHLSLFTFIEINHCNCLGPHMMFVMSCFLIFQCFIKWYITFMS